MRSAFFSSLQSFSNNPLKCSCDSAKMCPLTLSLLISTDCLILFLKASLSFSILSSSSTARFILTSAQLRNSFPWSTACLAALLCSAECLETATLTDHSLGSGKPTAAFTSEAIGISEVLGFDIPVCDLISDNDIRYCARCSSSLLDSCRSLENTQANPIPHTALFDRRNFSGTRV